MREICTSGATRAGGVEPPATPPPFARPLRERPQHNAGAWRGSAPLRLGGLREKSGSGPRVTRSAFDRHGGVRQAAALVIGLSLAQARCLHLAAQGLLTAPRGRATKETLLGIVARMGVLQIDSIHV